MLNGLFLLIFVLSIDSIQHLVSAVREVFTETSKSWQLWYVYRSKLFAISLVSPESGARFCL